MRRLLDWTLLSLASACTSRVDVVGESTGSSAGSTDAATTTTGTDGPGAHEPTTESDPTPGDLGFTCGDGIVDPGEQCDGNIVAGHRCPATCAFPPHTLLWELVFDGGMLEDDNTNGLAISPDGQILVTGDAGLATFVALIQQDGSLSWTQNFDTPSLVSDAEWLPDGTAVACGTTRIRTLSHGWLGLLDTDGNLLSEVIYEEGETELDLTSILPNSAEGLVTAVGKTHANTADAGRLVTWDLRSRSASAEVFGLQRDGVLFYAVGVSDSRGILLSGAAHNGEYAGWVQQREHGGNILWELILPNGDMASAGIKEPAVGPDGNIAVTMPIRGEADDPSDVWVALLDPEGNTLWEDLYAGRDALRDSPGGIAVDERGRLFVHAGVPTDEDIVVLAYSPTGERRWVDTYHGPGLGTGPIAVDPNGFIVQAGYTMTPNLDYDVIVRMLTP